jgi:hypothetical protein
MISSIHHISLLRQRMIDNMRMRKLSPQNPIQLYPGREAIREVPGAVAGYRQRRGILSTIAMIAQNTT